MARTPRKRRKRILQKIKKIPARWSGHQPLRRARLRIANRVAQLFGLVVTSTTGGTHATNSYHYQARAEDLASWDIRKMKAAQRAIALVIGKRNIKELFGPAAWYIKDGVKIKGAFPDHGDHVHLAV